MAKIEVVVPQVLLELMPESILAPIRAGIMDIKSVSLVLDYYKRFNELRVKDTFYSFTDRYGCLAGMCVSLVETESEDISIWWFIGKRENKFTVTPCKLISTNHSISFYDLDTVSLRSRFIGTFPEHQKILDFIHEKYLIRRWIDSGSTIETPSDLYG